MCDAPVVQWDFSGEVIEWRGPAPFLFLPVPEAESAQIESLAAAVTYGWGMIPVTVHLGEQTWTTSLWPKDGGYVVPLKVAVRRRADLDEGDTATARLVLDV